MAMTTEEVLESLRYRIQQVDQVTSDLTDEELLAVIKVVHRSMVARLVPSMVDLTVQPIQEDDEYGITPEPLDDMLGSLLVVAAAAEILDQIYRGRLYRGELGVAWTSGLESESSISAEKAYRACIDKLAKEYDELLLIHRRLSAASRLT